MLVCFGKSKGHGMVMPFKQSLYTAPTETYQGRTKLTMQSIVLPGYVNEHREIPELVKCDNLSGC